MTELVHVPSDQLGIVEDVCRVLVQLGCHQAWTVIHELESVGIVVLVRAP